MNNKITAKDLYDLKINAEKAARIVLNIKRLKYGYSALGRQSNIAMLSRSQNLDRLKRLLNLKHIELREF